MGLHTLCKFVFVSLVTVLGVVSRRSSSVYVGLHTLCKFVFLSLVLYLAWSVLNYTIHLKCSANPALAWVVNLERSRRWVNVLGALHGKL